MNNLIRCYVWLQLFAAMSNAQSNDAGLLFVQQLVTEAQNADEDYWDSERGGGYLFRFNYDVTRDGIPEQFFASSFMMGSNPRTNPRWTVYQRTSDGAFRKLAADLELGTGGITVSELKDGIRLFHWIPLEQRGEWQLSYYEFHQDGSFREIPETASEKQDRGITISPAVEKILLGEYLQDPAALWRPFASQFACYQQINDPADATALTKIGPLTLEGGSKAINRLVPPRDAPNVAANKSTVTVPLAPNATHSANAGEILKPTPSNGGRLVIIASAVSSIVAGIVWLARRRHRR